jgi:serine/threonine-protein kinase
MPTATSAPPGPHAKKPPSPKPGSPRISSGSNISSGRFAPGEVLAERYRILDRLGRGGMGEVYRADDLTLGQPVALKFLPPASAQDSVFIDRFRAEVRNARGISHANVCRVYDIGEVDGQHFISMEYVDGEDLATLLRRIGRLPGAKALEITRQLCAGLAAAHNNGVLHRDLKPANIMIDGQGQARITDFGLAVRSEELHVEGQVAGTPAYMSPEQLEGKGATAKSDIYALGLVLYEIFTGKRAFEGSTLADFRRKHSLELPPQPSSLVVEIDPAVERVIMRCLEKDPRARPVSALAVAAALPGGDPLAAALAAGETPSPELVAAAGETEGFKPRAAVACLAFVIVGVLAVCFLECKVQMINIVPLPYAPEALAAKASDMINQFGYTTPPVDTALLFDYDDDYLKYIASHDKSANRWEQLRSGNPSAILFWYRTSPRYLQTDMILAGNYVTPVDPARNVSGMTYVILDPSGRLQKFEAIPPQFDPSQATATPPDWAAMFKAAGLDIAQFKPAEPEWTSPNWGDVRAAWAGVAPARPDLALRVEAAAYRGKPVYFELIWPWTRPERMQAIERSAQDQIARVGILTMFFSALIGAVLLARRNLSLGRGDRRGAFRLAVFVLVFQFLGGAFNAHHVPTFYEFLLFVMGISLALFFAAFIWLLYIGLEPHVRRRWPTSIISWSRALAGQFRDPLVGRHVLTGVTLGIAYSLVDTLQQFAEGAFGKLPPPPWEQVFYLVRGTGGEIGHILHDVPSTLGSALLFFFLFFLLRLILRKDWIAAAAFVLISSAFGLAGNYGLVDSMFNILIYGGVIFILMRFGLLPLFIFFLTGTVLREGTLTSNLSAWYAGPVYYAVFFTLALAIYGFQVSLAGRPVFSGTALDE